jgi:hypothetical protein
MATTIEMDKKTSRIGHQSQPVLGAWLLTFLIFPPPPQSICPETPSACKAAFLAATSRHSKPALSGLRTALPLMRPPHPSFLADPDVAPFREP